MLDFLGRGVATTCNGATRRDFLKVGTLGAIGFSLADYLAAKAAGNVAAAHDDRSAIMIFNLGAPSQLDTFDMKPDAPAEIRGPFKPISTASPDIQISEIFPLHAKIADKFSLVRSCHHGGAAVHDAGWQVMQTGRVFRGRREHAARGFGRQLPARPPNGPAGRSSCCRKRWVAAAAICRTGRPADSWARRTIRFR